MSEVRVHIPIEGIVQGVGFRPFVYSLAEKHHLRGWIRNDEKGVEIEIEGDPEGVSALPGWGAPGPGAPERGATPPDLLMILVYK